MSQPLDYRAVESSSPYAERIRTLRVAAGALGFVAFLWAVFGTFIVIEDETWRHGPWSTLWVYGSSYVIAIGLSWRAWGRPSRNGCRAIWALSFVVQGAWLSLMVFETFFSAGGGGLFGVLFTFVIAGCTFVSLAGVILEPERL
jgi:hypothetical protein